jgi:tetratricopeptide (TPR) repeat protein
MPSLPEKKVLIFGTGKSAQSVLDDLLRFSRSHILGFAENDSARQGIPFQGLPVYPPEKILEIDFDYVLIASMHAEDIRCQLADTLGIPSRKIAYPLAVYFTMAVTAISTNRFDLAQHIIQTASEVYGEQAAHEFRADMAFAREDWPQVITCLEPLLLSAKQFAKPLWFTKLGIAYRRMLDPQRSEAILAQGLRLHPESSALQKEFAQSATVLRDWHQAISRWRQVMHNPSSAATAYVKIVTACKFLGDHDAMARMALEMAAATVPSFNPAKWEGIRSELVEAALSQADVDIQSRMADLETEADAPPAEWWLSLFFYFYGKGRLSLAYRFKHIAVSIAADTRHPYYAEQLQILGALLETGRITDADRFLADKLSTVTHRQQRAAWHRNQAAALYLTGRKTEAFAIWENPSVQVLIPTYHSPRFEELVRNKTVAVVGAANVDLESGEEIDSHDLVIRTNFLGRPTQPDIGRKIGFRTSISYYVQHFATQQLGEFLSGPLSNHLDAAVFHYGEDLCRVLQSTNPRMITRAYGTFFPGVFMGIPLAAERITLDLLSCRPKSIKVFNCDFYLGEDTHHGAYNQIKGSFPIKLAHHDLLRNIRHARTLFHQGGIQVDQRLAEILALDDTAILAAIQARWHSPAP